MRLKARIEELERDIGAGLRPWHRVLVDDGETDDQALARHQAEHGPVGGDNLCFRRFVRPMAVQ